MSTQIQAPAGVALTKAAAEKKYPAKMPRHGNANLYRRIVIGLLAIAVLAPVGLIIYQSFLTAAFFSPRAKFGLDAYKYVFTDKNFYKALGTTAIFSFGMVAIAVPLGGLLAFLITRTDIKGKRLLEIFVLVPMFISSIVLAFGYTVSVAEPDSSRSSFAASSASCRGTSTACPA